MRERKGQITIEFILSTLFFIIMLGALIFIVVDYVPEIENLNKRAQVNMETRRVTSMLLTSPGLNSTGSTDWELSPNSVESIGLASSYHVVEKSKLDALNTRSVSKFNYSQFQEVTDAENDYRMSFTVLPIIDTSENYLRTEPPENPNITEPGNSDFLSAGNTVNYGSILMGGNTYNVLVTSHDGSYDTLYKNQHSVSGWNFTDAPRFASGDSVELGGRNFTVKSFQNRGDESGTLVVLSRDLKIFGSSLVVDSTIVRLNRYAALEQTGANLQPLRIEVFAWRN